MKVALVLTDSSGECRKALEWLARYEEAFGADPEVFIVLEDLYRLEDAGVSLGIPIPPGTVKSAKEEFQRRVINLWRRVKDDDDAKLSVETVAGVLREEVVSFTERSSPDILLWGCHPTAELCRVIESVNVPSLIIK
ncbi:MAG TPA: hypothetical protein EYH49_01520 [Aquifex aeolicus]|nr:hypothetical protein [Aquifex aeolicus]